MRFPGKSGDPFEAEKPLSDMDGKWRRIALLAPLLIGGCTAELGGTGSEGTTREPTDADRNGTTTDWGGEIDRAEPFTGPIEASAISGARFSRLTHTQYENTVRDLLRLSEGLELAQGFVAEPLITTFDTDASHLLVSSDLRGDYERAAETVAALLTQDEDVLKRAVGSQVVSKDGFIESFGSRAFRRPLSGEEKSRLGALFDQGGQLVGSGDAFLDGVYVVVAYLLQSPHFLYRSELADEESEGKVPLSPFEVASKLSYALTGSLPDDELWEAASSGALLEHDALRTQAARLLKSDGGRRTVRDFHEQLLKMRDFEEISKNQELYPDFGAGSSEDLLTEPRLFVDHVVYELEEGLKELLTASYTFANNRVARLYGVPEPGSDEFSLVPLPDDQRAGLLTQIGFLAAHGEGSTPNSILRGVAIAHNVLCVDLPPPPDDVPPLEEATGATNRERIENLTADPGCATCHATYINPLGFAFEKLDGVGAFRESEGGIPVDASSSYLLDGEEVSFDGAPEFMQLLAGSAQAHDCYAKHVAQYLFGRVIDPDEPADEALVVQGGWLSQSDASVQELILQIVSTDAFLTRGI